MSVSGTAGHKHLSLKSTPPTTIMSRSLPAQEALSSHCTLIHAWYYEDACHSSAYSCLEHKHHSEGAASCGSHYNLNRNVSHGLPETAVFPKRLRRISMKDHTELSGLLCEVSRGFVHAAIEEQRHEHSPMALQRLPPLMLMKDCFICIFQWAGPRNWQFFEACS